MKKLTSNSNGQLSTGVQDVGMGNENGDWKNLDSIEMWNPTNETWTMTKLKLTKPRLGFGILARSSIVSLTFNANL